MALSARAFCAGRIHLSQVPLRNMAGTVGLFRAMAVTSSSGPSPELWSFANSARRSWKLRPVPTNRSTSVGWLRPGMSLRFIDNAHTQRPAFHTEPSPYNSIRQADISGVIGVGEFVRDLTLIPLLRPNEL